MADKVLCETLRSALSHRLNLQVTHNSGATIDHSPVEALKGVRKIFLFLSCIFDDGQKLQKINRQMETDEILVHCTLCWTVCTLNPGYHLLKDSWADPCLQQLPSYAQRLTSNKTIRWMTMRTWSPSHMQNLGWWDLAKLSCSIANGFMCFFTSNVRSTFYNRLQPNDHYH